MKVKDFSRKRSLRPIATSAQLEAVLMPFGERVLAAAKRDPSEYYRSLLQVYTRISKPASNKSVPHVAVVVGVRRDAKRTGELVEAKRGTLAKALGEL